MGFLDDISNGVKAAYDVLQGAAKAGEDAARKGVQATNEQIVKDGGTPPAQETRAYMINDNDTGKDSYIRVYFDPIFKDRTRVEEYVDGKAISYDTPKSINDFFKNMQKQKNISVFSAPIDATAPYAWPDEYNEKATVLYDTAVDGEIPYSNIFDYNNYGISWFGNRRSSRYKQRPDSPNVQSFEDAYREEKRLYDTIDNDISGDEIPRYYGAGGRV